MRPAKRQAGFDDPPVPRAAGVLGGCILATIVALIMVFYLLSAGNEPPEPRFDVTKDPPRLAQPAATP